MSQTSTVNYFYLYCRRGLKLGFLSKGGRNFSGRICVAHRRSLRRNFYFIDNYRRVNSYGVIFKKVKDLSRTAFLGGIFYQNGLFSYITLSEGNSVGTRIYSGSQPPKTKVSEDEPLIFPGYALPLKYIKLFSLVSNIEVRPFQGFSLAKAAGSSAILISKSNSFITLKLKSGWLLKLKNTSMAVFGTMSNMEHRFQRKGKAGVNFHRGRRPVVRGVAMNPCDHPHGGGEGKKSPRVAPVSPWGWLTKGTPTKNKKKDKMKKKLYKILR